MSEQQSSQQQNRSQLLVIDREKWLRGEGDEASWLLRPSDGKMCCVGFYCLSLGISEEGITGVTWPRSHWGLVPEWLKDGNTVRLDRLAPLNDGVGMDESEREKQIVAVFAKYGVEVEFIN